jgi:hypothetical protein
VVRTVQAVTFTSQLRRSIWSISEVVVDIGSSLSVVSGTTLTPVTPKKQLVIPYSGFYGMISA